MMVNKKHLHLGNGLAYARIAGLVAFKHVRDPRIQDTAVCVERALAVVFQFVRGLLPG
jgi:hypothetical protein